MHPFDLQLTVGSAAPAVLTIPTSPTCTSSTSRGQNTMLTVLPRLWRLATTDGSVRLLCDGRNRAVQDPIGPLGLGFQQGIGQASEIHMDGTTADLEKAKTTNTTHEARELEMAA